jgi:hypothetical protein
MWMCAIPSFKACAGSGANNSDRRSCRKRTMSGLGQSRRFNHAARMSLHPRERAYSEPDRLFRAGGYRQRPHRVCVCGHRCRLGRSADPGTPRELCAPNPAAAHCGLSHAAARAVKRVIRIGHCRTGDFNDGSGLPPLAAVVPKLSGDRMCAFPFSLVLENHGASLPQRTCGAQNWRCISLPSPHTVILCRASWRGLP